MHIFRMMSSVKQKIYRDDSRRILGGVCSGLSFYLSIDKVFLRLAFFFCIFFFGITIPLYIILWAIIPKARTSIERAEMTGEQLGHEVGKGKDNIKKSYSRKSATVSEINSLDLSRVNKLSMLLLLFFCSLSLFVILSFSFSFPFVIDVFRDVDLLVRLKYSLTGILVGEKAFSLDSISILGTHCIPFVAGLVFALKQLKKIEIQIAIFKYLGIAWLFCLVLNYLL